METCKVLFPGTNVYDRLVLILSDQAKYMVKAMQEIKRNTLIFPNVCHVTCLAHALNVVASEIQKQFVLVNKYLAESKKFLLKSNKRKFDFVSKTGLSLPPTPVLTRWGTWLKAVAFHLNNYSVVKSFILSYKPDSKSEAFELIKKMMSGSKLEKDLYELRKFVPLAVMITKLEEHGLSMESQMNLVNEAKVLVMNTPFETKLESSLSKNPDLVKFTSETAPDLKVKREFCPLVSVEVERSFSMFKNVLRPNRMQMTTENIKQYMIVHYNSFL